MEFSLQNCEEVWLSKVFELKSITRKRINVSFFFTPYIGNLRLPTYRRNCSLFLWALASDFFIPIIFFFKRLMKRLKFKIYTGVPRALPGDRVLSRHGQDF